MGGFNATSNVLAGQLYHVPVAGTHAHAFVSSFAQGEERILALAAYVVSHLLRLAPLLCCCRAAHPPQGRGHRAGVRRPLFSCAC